MKKALIITYYWPPSGGIGVRRWLGFSNNFHHHHWKPIIFCPSNADYSTVDKNLLGTVHKKTDTVTCPIFEPYRLYRSFLGQKEDAFTPENVFDKGQESLKHKFSLWIRSNFFFPDARMFWIRPAIKKLETYLREHSVDVIISTGPPHSAHIIALNISKKFKLPWVADFRDPWTNISFFPKLTLTKFMRKKHENYEHKVLTQSHAQTTVSWSWAKDFEQLGAKNVHVITNGYDPENYHAKIELDKAFTITHLGSMNQDRHHSLFWKSIRDLIFENQDFAKKINIQLIGFVDDTVKEEIKQCNLKNYCRFIPFLSHPEGIKTISSSRILYLAASHSQKDVGIIPGKTFEYLATKRPILAIGLLKSDVAKIIRETKNTICNFDDKESIKSAIKKHFEKFQHPIESQNSLDFKKFSRKELTQKMISLIEEVSQRKP